MKKIISIFIALFISVIAFADTVHIFIPEDVTHSFSSSGGIGYEHKIYKNMNIDSRALPSKNTWSVMPHTNMLRIVDSNGKIYYFNCEWWVEPDV